MRTNLVLTSQIKAGGAVVVNRNSPPNRKMCVYLLPQVKDLNTEVRRLSRCLVQVLPSPSGSIPTEDDIGEQTTIKKVVNLFFILLSCNNLKTTCIFKLFSSHAHIMSPKVQKSLPHILISRCVCFISNVFLVKTTRVSCARVLRSMLF